MLQESLAEFVHAIRRRIHNHIGRCTQSGELFLFGPNPLEDSPVSGSRVGAAGFAKAPYEDIGAGFKVQDRDLVALLAQSFKDRRVFVQKNTLAQVNAEGHAANMFLIIFAELKKSGDEGDREIIDAVESTILKDADCGTFSRA